MQEKGNRGGDERERKQTEEEMQEKERGPGFDLTVIRKQP